MNILTDKSISQIGNEIFVIPIYQRAYKWRKTQVQALLDDILEFDDLRNGNKKMSYCLQPIIVKFSNLINGWSVIDGQQRLTTIKLILNYLDKPTYTMIYPSRKETEIFFKDIKAEIDTSNSDHYFMSSAFITIKNWFEEKDAICEFSREEYYIALSKYTKFIWYELNTVEDERDVFTRINMGKIPLNNAELIRALFLNESNWSADEYTDIYLKQIALANEWNNIETSLQHNEFWHFIIKGLNKMDSRIEYLFELDKPKPKGNADTYFTFSQFNTEIKDHKANKFERIQIIWGRILFLHQILMEWYTDWELYHKIGYLITNGSSVIDLIENYKESKKDVFINHVNSLMLESINEINLDKLNYKEQKDKIKIHKILLLFNINTILKGKDEGVRFSFFNFKNEDDNKKTWSLEHINAQNIEKINTEEHWREWLLLHKDSLKRIDRIKY
jgi:hypothetical protein